MSGLDRRIKLVQRNISAGASKWAAPKDGPSKAELREQLAQAVRNTAASRTSEAGVMVAESKMLV